MSVDTPPEVRSYINYDTLRGLEQLSSQPNDAHIPQIFKMVQSS